MLSQHQKFHKATKVTQKLASLASEGGMDQFNERFGLLKRLRDEWASGGRVVLSSITISGDNALPSVQRYL